VVKFGHDMKSDNQYTIVQNKPERLPVVDFNDADATIPDNLMGIVLTDMCRLRD